MTMHDMRRDLPGLTEALHALAEEDAANGASEAVRARLLGEVRLVRRTRRRSALKSLAIAAGLFAATAWPVWRLAVQPPLGGSPSIHRVGLGRDDEIATDFFPLMYSTVPMSGGRIIRVEVSPAALDQAVLDAVRTGAGVRPTTILADVLVGQDGLARAIRFVRPLTREEQQEQQP